MQFKLKCVAASCYVLGLEREKHPPYIQWLCNRLEKYWIFRNLWQKCKCGVKCLTESVMLSH